MKSEIGGVAGSTNRRRGTVGCGPAARVFRLDAGTAVRWSEARSGYARSRCSPSCPDASDRGPGASLRAGAAGSGGRADPAGRSGRCVLPPRSPRPSSTRTNGRFLGAEGSGRRRGRGSRCLSSVPRTATVIAHTSATALVQLERDLFLTRSDRARPTRRQKGREGIAAAAAAADPATGGIRIGEEEPGWRIAGR